jgi:hypothetical protein
MIGVDDRPFTGELGRGGGGTLRLEFVDETLDVVLERRELGDPRFDGAKQPDDFRAQGIAVVARDASVEPSLDRRRALGERFLRFRRESCDGSFAGGW